jgi:hypothetical protein
VVLESTNLEGFAIDPKPPVIKEPLESRVSVFEHNIPADFSRNMYAHVI